MNHTHWSDVDQCVTATAGVPVRQLLDEARARKLHLGTLHAHDGSVGDVMAQADPTWCARIIQVRVEGPQGLFGSPLAPRAAVGPDLACFAVGTRAQLDQVTFRACKATSWATASFPSPADALGLADTLLQLGVTGVHVRPGPTWRVDAVLPRPMPRIPMAPCAQPGWTQGSQALAWTLPSHALDHTVRQLSGHGDVVMEALDTHFWAVRLLAPPLDAGTLQQLEDAHLGKRQPTPFDVVRALRLKPTLHGRPRV